MAKKENENEFEDLTGGASDNINEADDNFGLPDINYEPLDRTEEKEPEPPSEPASEPEETEEYSVPWATSDDSSTEDTIIEETTVIVDETSTESEEQPVMYAQSMDDDSSESGDSTISESSDDASEEASEGESEYVPGTYAAKYEKQNNSAMIWVAVFAVIILGIGGWWFFIEQPKREAAEQQAIAAQQQADRARAEQARIEAERQRQAEAEAAAAEAETAVEEEEVAQEPGTVQTISERTGRYYVVVASAIDGDLAMDYARDLAAAGRSVSIIGPYGSVKFHRVAVDNMQTLGEAEAVLGDLRAEYEGAWVMKY